MVKPIGIVAMLVLLMSRPALADEDNNVFIKHIDVWGVTNTGSLYLETKRGEKYSVPISHCPVVRTNKNFLFTPVELVHTFDDADVWFRSRLVSAETRVTFVDRKSRDRISCILGNPKEIS